MARSTCCWLAVTALLAWTGSAHASLLGQSVDVTLTDGSTLNEADTVLVGAGPEITPGDGSNVGTLLLPNESVDLGDFVIEVVLEEGASNHTTGYPAGTHYLFSNLGFGDPLLKIVGVGVASDNIANLSPGSVSFTQDSVTLSIDALTIGSIPNSVDVGSVTLSLEVASIPEPSPLALVGLALAGLAALRGRRSALA